MKQFATNYWIILRLESRSGSIWAGYEDSSGFRLKPSRISDEDPQGWTRRELAALELRQLPANLRSGRSRLIPSTDFLKPFYKMMKELPDHRNYGSAPELPLAIFVKVPDGTQLLDWEAVVLDMLRPGHVFERERIQVVRLARERWSARPPFRLPFRLLGSGDRLKSALDVLRKASWFRDDVNVQEYGLHIAYTETDKLAAELRSKTYDIVLVDESGIETALRASRRLRRPMETRPRLIFFADYLGDDLFSASLALPPSMSLLRAPMRSSANLGSLIKELILALIHDYPLHEAAKTIMRNNEQDLKGAVSLYADPLSNQDLRMADALEQLRDEAFEAAALVSPGAGIDAFLARVRKYSGEEASNLLASHLYTAAQKRGSDADEAIDFSRRPGVGFDKESAGLRPMAALAAKLNALIKDAKTARNAMASSLKNITADPDLANIFEASQDRRVETTMDYMDQNDIYLPFTPAWDQLQTGSIYRLNVFVGHQMPNSLLVGDPPPLDPLLPDPEGETGHELEVAVFEKGLKLLSPRVQTLHLPRYGGSLPVKFEFRTPTERRPVELRTSVYHNNYLLQSFLLTADLANYSEPQVKVELDFSRTSRFTNLQELKPRLLSIGSNLNSDGRSHSFFLKKDQSAAQPIDMTEAVANGEITRFRDIVKKAAEDWGHFEPNLSDRPKKRDQEAFEAVIRELAELGGELHDFLYDHSPKEMQKKLQKVWEASDEVIQITRHKTGFAFPWPVIYDYPRPTIITGSSPARVCMGETFTDAPPESRRGRGCSHNPHEEVYCVEGFWSVRHQLEQLIEQGDALRDAVSAVDRPKTEEGICLASGLVDKYIDQLINNFQQKLKDDFATLDSKDELFERLWAPERRPAIFILLSQLLTLDKVGQPKGTRMPLSPESAAIGGDPRKAWLQPRDITGWSKFDGKWDDQPRTLVLLMACESAASAFDTLNNYLTSLTGAGASAIVGTETSVLSDLVTMFAEQVTLKLWQDNETLGEAIQSFNRRMIASYNPLAFVFNCFGSADIKLV